MTTAVYVSNADSGDIWTLHLDAATGSLRPVQRMMVGGAVMPLALGPVRGSGPRHLYAARRSDPLEVMSFSIDAATGQLSRLAEAPLPQSMCDVASDRTGRFLFSASYGGNLVAVSPIGADGIAQAAQQVLATPPKAHMMRAEPSNRFVFAASLGGGVLLQFRFDAASGALTPNDPPTFSPRANASPRHFVFSADARRLYLLSELDAAIDVLALDADTGTLSAVQTIGTLPPAFEGEPWAADLHLTPDGRFLYACERRSNTLTGFAVDAASGELTLIGRAMTEAQPRSFAITPDGAFLIAAGQLSHRVSVHAIDARSGGLIKCSDCAVGQTPSWIECVPLVEAGR